MKYFGYIEAEGRYFSFEINTIIRDHLVAAAHGADGCSHHGTRGILEILAGAQVRRFANNAFALDLLCFTITVGDDPVTCEQLGRYIAGVLYGDRL